MNAGDSPAEIDFVMPVYNEGPNIARALEEIYQHVTIPKRVLIVYDFDEDDTLPAVRPLLPKYPGVELVKNNLGKGVLNAVRAGIAAARAEVVIVTMADLSDDLTVVSKMVEMIRDKGYDVVCASRYMKGGQQIGGPKFKSFLSRMAGLSLHWLAGLPTHDATNAFRAYRRSVLAETQIESRGGFEYSLEITAKAFANGRKIGEVPSTWRDRSAGQSRFKLAAWLPQYLRWYNWTIDRSARADRLALAALMILALVFGLGSILRRPELSANEGFVLGEAGNQLYRNDRIAAGGLLYRDMACQYGPIPVYLQSSFAAIAGNTITANLLWHLTFNVIAIALAYRVLRRGAGVATSLGFATVVCLPTMLAPGGSIGSGINAEYQPIEKICLLLVMLLWKPTDQRSLSRALSIGLALGMWQGVKFGGAFVAGASVLVLDLLTLPPLDRSRALKRAVPGWLAIGAGFLAVEAVWLVLAYTNLPSWLAFETVFPFYIAPAYKLFPERYPGWGGVGLFLTQQWMPLLCLVTGLAAIANWLFRITTKPTAVSDTERNHAGLALGLVFFAIAVPIYLKQAFLIYRFVWVLAFPAAWAVARWRPSRQIAFALVALPSFLLMSKATFLNRPAADIVQVGLPTGESLHMTRDAAEEIAAVKALPRQASTNDDPGHFSVVLFSWGGGGYYHYFDKSFPLRNFMTDAIVLRPQDEQAMEQALPRIHAFAIRVSEFSKDADPAAPIRSAFSAAFADRVLAEFKYQKDLSKGRIQVFARELPPPRTWR